MRAFRTLNVFVLLLCLVPPLSLLMAALMARWAGCELDLPPNTPIPCLILGGDAGDVLFALAGFGWYTIETLPAFAAVVTAWLIVELVNSLSRKRVQRERPAPSSSSAFARNLRRPQPAASRNRIRGS